MSFAQRLIELQAAQLPHLTWHDVFEITSGKVLPEDESLLAEYFDQFTSCPTDGEHQLCVCCREKMRGGVESLLGIGVHLEWSLVHGEAFCSKCHWPYRVYHRNVGPIKSLTAGLPYHPDRLRVEKDNE